MTDLNAAIQLFINSIGAILGVAVTFFFLTPFINKMFEQQNKNMGVQQRSIDLLNKSIQKHEQRANERHTKTMEEFDMNRDKMKEQTHLLDILYKLRPKEKSVVMSS